MALVTMMLCLVRVVSWQLTNASSELEMTPHGERLMVACALAVPLFPAAALLWSAITRRLKTRLAVVLVLQVVLGAVAGFLALFLWAGPLFGGHWQTMVPSPDGTQEAHLRIDGLLGCGGTVYLSEPRGIWARPGVTRAASCKDIGVAWLPDGGVEITGSPPEPFNLNFGPH